MIKLKYDWLLIMCHSDYVTDLLCVLAALTADEESRLEWIISGQPFQDGSTLSKRSHLIADSAFATDVILEFGPR